MEERTYGRSFQTIGAALDWVDGITNNSNLFTRKVEISREMSGRLHASVKVQVNTSDA